MIVENPINPSFDRLSKSIDSFEPREYLPKDPHGRYAVGFLHGRRLKTNVDPAYNITTLRDLLKWAKTHSIRRLYIANTAQFHMMMHLLFGNDVTEQLRNHPPGRKHFNYVSSGPAGNYALRTDYLYRYLTLAHSDSQHSEKSLKIINAQRLREDLNIDEEIETLESFERWIELLKDYARYLGISHYLGNEIISVTSYTKALIHKHIVYNLISPGQHVPKSTLELAYNSIHAPLINVYQVGHVAQGVEYDFASAYATVLASLPATDEGSGVWTNKEPSLIIPSYGFCLARVCIKSDVNITPIPFRGRSNVTYFPTGEWIGNYTYEDLNFIRDWKMGEVEIYEGSWFIPSDNKPNYPFKILINKLFNWREEAEREGNSLKRLLIKKILISITGKTNQKHMVDDNNPYLDDMTVAGLWNPVFYSSTVARTRLSLVDILYKNPHIDPIRINTDGMQIAGSDFSELLETPSLYGLKLIKKSIESEYIQTIHLFNHRANSITERALTDAIFNNPNAKNLILEREWKNGNGESHRERMGFTASKLDKGEFTEDTPVFMKDLTTKLYKIRPKRVEEIPHWMLR